MKIGYVCKYTPVEIFESMGIEMELIEPEEITFSKADRKLHPNVCSYVKGVCQAMDKKNYDGIILTNCCDSMKRYFDVEKNESKGFVLRLDIPRKQDKAAERLFSERISRLIYEVTKKTGKNFCEEYFIEYAKQPEKKDRINSDGIPVVVEGGRINSEIKDIIENRGGKIIFDATCSGIGRTGLKGVEYRNADEYAKKLLKRFPCLRMYNTTERERLLEEVEKNAKGVIYHTVKFCDIYSYEFAMRRTGVDLPMLKIETDLAKQSAGQVKTRIDAFMESIGGCGFKDKCAGGGPDYREELIETAEKEMKMIGKNKKKKTGEEVFVIGIDSGSTSTNAVVINGEKKIISSVIIRTGAKAKESAQRAKEQVIKNAGLSEEDISLIVSTGYGRENIGFADRAITEITCHGRGAKYLFPEVVTVLDIGGQDSKSIRLDSEGNVVDFVMNDKCAAGTGRFLEAIAATLEISVCQLAQEALNAKEDIEISSMCTVFAESEVISLIAENKDIPDIAAGVCRSIAGKAVSLMKRTGLQPPLMMTGGVARNKGVINALEEMTGEKFFIPENPDIAGALGAALFALDSLN